MRCRVVCSSLFRWVCLVFVVGLSASGQARAQTITLGNDYRVDFVGESGGLKLYPVSGASFLKLSWAKLMEVDPQGRTVQGVNNFASSGLSWDTPSSVLRNGYNATQVTLTSRIAIPSSSAPAPLVRVTTLAFETEATILENNQTVTVPKDNLKWSVHIAQWPFKSASNVLVFGCSVLSPGGRGGQGERTRVSNSTDRFTFGAGSIEVFHTGVADGRIVPVTTETFTQGASTGVQWMFPSFNHSLDYDPFLAVGNAISAAHADATVSLGVIGWIACLTIALLR